jgi:hypothetical protein
MLLAVDDWRAGPGRYQGYDDDLFASEDEAPPLDTGRFVWRWCCQRCETFYLTICGAPAQPCPTCGQQLARVQGVWDLRQERAPRWWRSAGYDYDLRRDADDLP